MDHVLAIARPIVVLVIPVTFWILVFYFLFHNRRKKAKRKTSKPAPTIPHKVEPAHVEVHRKPELKCQCCDGHYVYREGPYGSFAGCSNFHSQGCKSKLRKEDFVRQLICEFGVNVYSWEKTCYKCHQTTTVYSYYLMHDLGQFIPPLKRAVELGLGDILQLDRLIARQFWSIAPFQRKQSGTYMANKCQCCGALQGHSFVVEDPDNEDIWDGLNRDGDMSEYLAVTVEVTEPAVIEAIVAAVCSYLE